MKVPPFCCYECKYCSNGSHLCQWAEGFFIVDAMGLCVVFCYDMGFVAVDLVVCSVLHLIYLQSIAFLCVNVEQGPCSIRAKCVHFLVHSFYPLWISCIFGKAFQLSYGCYLHHKSTTVCRVVVVANCVTTFFSLVKRQSFSFVLARAFSDTKVSS